ncbi:MAG: AzlD domain-containing protein [Deltaproteobacteria bacterium]|nr:AzlD domain-containing protein [Deltaproteobacteria bacterium]
MDQETIFITIIGMAVVTYIPRFLPAWLLCNRPLPVMVEKWLRLVPPAILAAMIFPSLFMNDSKLDVSPSNIFLLAAIPTYWAAHKTRNLLWPLVIGMGLVAGWRYFA